MEFRSKTLGSLHRRKLDLGHVFWNGAIFEGEWEGNNPENCVRSLGSSGAPATAGTVKKTASVASIVKCSLIVGGSFPGLGRIRRRSSDFPAHTDLPDLAIRGRVRLRARQDPIQPGSVVPISDWDVVVPNGRLATWARAPRSLTEVARIPFSTSYMRISHTSVDQEMGRASLLETILSVESKLTTSAVIGWSGRPNFPSSARIRMA